MSVRRPWINAARPLVPPLLVLIALCLLATRLHDLSFIDRDVIHVVQLLPLSLTPEFTFITNIGSPVAVTIVAVVIAIFEATRRHWMRALVMLASLSSLLAFYVVKEIVRRARPVTQYVASHGLHDYSFPSGHSTGSATVYGLLIVLVAASRLRYRKTIITLLALLIFLVGLSRVYLGAHFPTDVLGAWLLAFIIVSLLRSLTLAVAKRSSRPTAAAVSDTTET